MTSHFKNKELCCKCVCGQQHMKIGFMGLLESLRMAYDKPMIVTSGYRCPAHNAKVSTTGRHGPHTTGQAIDIAVQGRDAHRLLTLALQYGFTGIGIKQKGDNRFIHLDNLMLDYPRPRIWSYWPCTTSIKVDNRIYLAKEPFCETCTAPLSPPTLTIQINRITVIPVPWIVPYL